MYRLRACLAPCLLALLVSAIASFPSSASSPDKLRFVLEVIRIDCDQAGGNREACQDSLASPSAALMDIPTLQQRFPAESLIKLPGAISVDETYAGATCMETRRLEGEFSIQPANNGQYLMSLSYGFSEEECSGAVDEMAGTTQLLLTETDGPFIVGSSTHDETDPNAQPPRRSVTMTLVLLRVMEGDKQP